MNLITILDIVSSIINKSPSLQSGDKEIIAKLASDISVYTSNGRMIFTKLNQSGPITKELLETLYQFAPYILFTYQSNRWFAEEATNVGMWNRMVDFKEYEDSIRIALVGFDSVSNPNFKVNIETRKQTLIVRVV